MRRLGTASALPAGRSLDVHQLSVDRGDPALLHDQVAGAIRRAIADGEAAPGERLPPARDLAAVLGVNTNTVLRALRMLRDEGLLEFRRGRGVTVAGTPQRSAVLVKARELVSFARRQGYRRDELLSLIESLA
ncbi:MAG TPA: GntR family transcriptional regulator [Acidimicrobiales bacterium]|nr:GntR family transcriptional regulator [Acidimicrobiales bacterium]